MILALSASCELFEDPVGEITINDHKISWDQGKPSHIELWWDWADGADEHILER